MSARNETKKKELEGERKREQETKRSKGIEAEKQRNRAFVTDF